MNKKKIKKQVEQVQKANNKDRQKRLSEGKKIVTSFFKKN